MAESMTLSLQRTTMELASIAGLSRLNPRHHHSKDGIAELAASLQASGQIEALGVHEEGGKYFVLAGGRRWKALKQLAKAGKAWGAQSDGLVRIDLFSGSDTDLAALALASNVVREQMHPVEEYEAFATLSESMEVAAIAAAFGRAEREVRKSLALGRLVPEIRAAWKAGKLDADCARAFAISDSQEQQAAVYTELAKRGRLVVTPYEIKRRLRVDTLKPTDGESVFVGEEAYRAAGGRVGEDLFEDQIIWRDGAICRRLAQDNLRDMAEAIKAADGWGFYTCDDASDAAGDDVFARDWSFRLDYLATEVERRDAIDDEVGALGKLIADPKTTSQARADAGATRAALIGEALAINRRAAARAVPQVVRRDWGFAIGINYDGDVSLEFGYRTRHDTGDDGDEFTDETELPRPSSRRGAREAAAAEGADPAAASDSDDVEKPSTGVRAVLDRTINLAFANAIASRPDIALAIALLSCAHIGGRVFGVSIDHQFGDEAFDRENPLVQALNRLNADKAARLVNAAPLADLSSAFAFAVATSVRADNNPFGSIADYAAAIIARGADLRRELLAAFDYAGYFAAATKDAALRTIEACDGPAAAEAKKLKKDALAGRAATLAKDRAWLPRPLSDWAAAQPVLEAPAQEAAE